MSPRNSRDGGAINRNHGYFVGFDAGRRVIPVDCDRVGEDGGDAATAVDYFPFTVAIKQDDIDSVRRASDLVEVAQGHTGLKKVGRRWMGLCPFHGEKTPSLSINGEEGLYYCHGCQAKGDVITFVREIEHVDFVEAVERLAARANIELHYDDEAAGKERRRRRVLSEAMTQAVDWYHDRLLKSPDAAAARGYLRERGYDGEVVRRFKIGWAPDGWDTLARALRLPESVLKDTGLGFVNRAGRQQDAFRGRVLFPIFDPSGSPVAFGGRVLPGGGEPKYKNSSETAIYAKSRTLYGLNWSKADVVATDEVVVCEGYTDVIGFFQAGVPRAVATCGTALTEEHVRQMRNFASRVVLAYDADKAGQAAAERFYEWERKLGIEIKVAKIPEGSDPAEAARADPKSLSDAVANAKPYLGFRIDRALDRADLRSPEGKARAAELCMAMIAEHPSEIVRDQYLMTVSDRCNVTPDRLRSMAARKPIDVRERDVVDVRRKRQAPSGELRAELEALQVAVQQPEGVAALLASVLPDSGNIALEEVLFTDGRCQAAFRALVDSPTLSEALACAEPEAADLLTRLAVEEEGGSVDVLLRLVDQAAVRHVRSLEVAARGEGGGWAALGTKIAWLKLNIERLRSPDTSLAAATDLLVWMSEEVPEPA